MVTQVGNIPNPSCISVSAARFYNNSLMENFEFWKIPRRVYIAEV